MRYIKVLILAVFLFLAMIFFFQNQVPLSQQMELNLNLFFIPPMKSISLPFYFIVIAAFLVGCVLSLTFLLWDKFNTSTRLMKTKWRVGNLERQVEKLQNQLDKANAQVTTARALPAAQPESKTDSNKKQEPEAAKA